MRNLLDETIKFLDDNNLIEGLISNVTVFHGRGTKRCSWEDFKTLARNINYDPIKHKHEVHPTLQIHAEWGRMERMIHSKNSEWYSAWRLVPQIVKPMIDVVESDIFKKWRQ